MNRYINREISWLNFNERVLLEAVDDNNPLMEKLKFIAISASNLDEFFMVRVAGLKDQIAVGYNEKDLREQTPIEQLKMINEFVMKLVIKQQQIFNELKTTLKKNKIILDAEITGDIAEIVENIFIDEIMPVLSPMTLDPSHPFPFIYNRRFSIIVKLEKKEKIYISLIMLPENMKRIYKVKIDDAIYVFKLEDIILANIKLLYKGYMLISSDIFRVTRNADIEVQKEEAADLITIIEDSISRRDKGAVARIEIGKNMSEEVINILKHSVQFDDDDLFIIDGDIDLTYLFQLYTLLPKEQFLPYTPFVLEDVPLDNSIFDRIKKKDILFFRPFYSFALVSKLISIAAADDDVLAIKMTLYRTNKDSSILSSLITAAQKGKQVSVVVELKARFDEERNISWAKNLERAGCIVSYGVANLKIHAKSLLIVRREAGVIKRYTHLATGNYNEITAEVYTDIDFITSDDMIGRDAAELFNYLMCYTDIDKWRALYVAPFNLKDRIIELIDALINEPDKSSECKMIMKMNSLVDRGIIDKLYDASSAGVSIDLIVRGICCLRPSVSGLSDNIKVKSIVGRFLEHSRIYYFKSASIDRLYISSADLMPRNLNGRVELMVEITDNDLKNYIKNYLQILLHDDKKGWQLHDTIYMKEESDATHGSQDYFLKNRLIK